MRIVQKYGGTSVGSIERIEQVAERVARNVRQGKQVAVVVSAMAGETNRLIALAHGITSTPDRREYDMLVASGEQVSISLLSIALHERGVKARSFLGSVAGIVTDDVHAKAHIASLEPDALEAAFAEGVTPIVAGFQGRSPSGEITTLGRGGSDLTAVAVAHSVQADACEIYTDVDGIYTADPRLVPKAAKVDKITFDEMLELASVGAKVLQTRSVEFALKYNVPIHVRHARQDGEGSWVVKEDKGMEEVVVSGLAHTLNEAKISLRDVPDHPGIAARIFDALAEQEVNVDLIIQNVSAAGKTDLSFTVVEEDAGRAMDVLEQLRTEVGFDSFSADPEIAKISAVGVGMQTHPGVAAKMFRTLSDRGINIEMISTSEIKISCVIRKDKATEALQALHTAFGLDAE